MGVLNMFGRITLDASAFHSTLSGIKGGVSKVSNALNSTLKGNIAAWVGAGAIIAATKNLVKYGSEINDVSLRINVGTDELQRFVYAAKQSGAGIEDITMAFKFLAKARQEALKDPKGEQAQAFTAVGIDQAMVKTGNLSLMFRKLGETVRTVNLGAGEQPLVEKLLGRGAGILIPMFIDGLAAMGEEADRVGAVLDAKVIAALDDVGDSIERIIGQMRGPFSEALKISFGGVEKMARFLNQVFGGLGAGLGAWSEMDKGGGNSGTKRKTVAEEWEVFITAWAEHLNQMDEDAAKVEEEVKTKRAKKILDRENRVLKPFEFVKPDVTKTKSERGLSPLTDSLRSVGNFLGGDPNSGVVKQLSEQTKQLIEIRRNTGRQAQGGAQFPL